MDYHVVVVVVAAAAAPHRAALLTRVGASDLFVFFLLFSFPFLFFSPCSKNHHSIISIHPGLLFHAFSLSFSKLLTAVLVLTKKNR